MIDQLQVLLAGPANEKVWEKIISLFEPWPGPEARAALDLALAGLESWPDRLRRCPVDWMVDLVLGELPQPIGLVRTLPLYWKDFDQDLAAKLLAALPSTDIDTVEVDVDTAPWVIAHLPDQITCVVWRRELFADPKGLPDWLDALPEQPQRELVLTPIVYDVDIDVCPRSMRGGLGAQRLELTQWVDALLGHADCFEQELVEQTKREAQGPPIDLWAARQGSVAPSWEPSVRADFFDSDTEWAWSDRRTEVLALLDHPAISTLRIEGHQLDWELFQQAWGDEASPLVLDGCTMILPLAENPERGFNRTPDAFAGNHVDLRVLDYPLAELHEEAHRLDLGAFLELGRARSLPRCLPASVRLRIFGALLGAEETCLEEIVREHHRCAGGNRGELLVGALSQLSVIYDPLVELSEYAQTSWSGLFAVEGPPTVRVVEVERQDTRVSINLEVCGVYFTGPVFGSCDYKKLRRAIVPADDEPRDIQVSGNQLRLESRKGVGFITRWVKSGVPDHAGTSFPGATRRPFLMRDLRRALKQAARRIKANEKSRGGHSDRNAPLYSPLPASKLDDRQNWPASFWFMDVEVLGAPDHPTTIDDLVKARPDELEWLWDLDALRPPALGSE